MPRALLSSHLTSDPMSSDDASADGLWGGSMQPAGGLLGDELTWNAFGATEGASSSLGLFDWASSGFGATPSASAAGILNGPAHGTATPVSTSSADPVIGDVSGSDGPEALSNKGGNPSSGSTTTTSTTTTTTTTTSPSGVSIKTVTAESSALSPPTGSSTLPTDSYFSQEWNLTSATAGIDVTKAWQNYTGAGVKIGVIDDGIDYNHPDLHANYLFNLQYDAETPDGSAYGTSTDLHGTRVAGVLAAADNGTGVVGVAYGAGITGLRIGYGSNGSPAQNADALNHLVTNGLDVGNCSWGNATEFGDNFSAYSFSPSKSAILNDVMNGRGGLGVDVVFAAGNGRASGDNVNYHNYQNDPYVIAVAATDANGHVASFSTGGAAVLVSAPGTYDYTTDRVSEGYVAVAGTSFAAPTVSGIIALMLQANANLGYRDVQEILAMSAKDSDPTSAGWTINGAHDWNGGGMHFNQDYGFGLVDATAAVRLAESWQKQSTYADMSTETTSHTDGTHIADGSGATTSQITFGTSLTLDKVVVDLNISESSVSDLSVTLTSSHGTTAQLVAHPSSGTGGGIVFEMSANNFMGEDALGTWTLKVADSVANGSTGTLNSWSLEATGDAATTTPDYVYTNEFASLTGSTRTVLNDATGKAMINTAAVTTGSYLDLHAGATDMIAGRALQIGATTTIKSVWGGDGNDTIIANDAGDVIQAGRGSDTIVAGHGADVINGGPGSDTFDFNFLKTVADTINGFAVGSDVLNMSKLFTSIGYTGTNAVADHWLSLTADASGTGTDFVVNAHNGTAPVVVADITHILPTALHQGTDYWTHA